MASVPDGSGLRATRPDVAVVIVNYRTPDLVERCVRTLLANSDGEPLDIVVVDNDSGDGSASMLTKRLGGIVRVVALDDNRGFAAGVNVGFASTDAPVVLLLNPDTEALPGALTALLRRIHSQPEAAVVAPLLLHEDGRLQVNGYRRFPGIVTMAVELCFPISHLLYWTRLHPFEMSPEQVRVGRRPAHVTGAVMAVRRQAYLQAGTLDESFFMYLEETEWQQRVVAAGWTIELAPGACFVHLLHGGGEAALAPSPLLLRSTVKYLHRNGVPERVSWFTFALSLGLSWLSLLPVACVPGQRFRFVQARAYRELFFRAVRGLLDSGSAPLVGA